MKAVILSAGQGRRLLPMTADRPKCALRLHGQTLIEWQIDALLAGGVEQVTAVVGYDAGRVDCLLAARYGHDRVSTLYNPFFEVADNLASCWMARAEMVGDFILLNGDTLFETAVLERLLESPSNPITLASDRKDHYDADDMKVGLDGDRLLRIGKDLAPGEVDGESIGMLRFRADGAAIFCEALENTMRRPEALRQWYLSVIDRLAQSGCVWSQSIEGLQWAEVDYPVDYDRALKMVAAWANQSNRQSTAVRLSASA